MLKKRLSITDRVFHDIMLLPDPCCKPSSDLLTGADIVPRLLGASLDRVHSTIGSYFQILHYFTLVRGPSPVVPICRMSGVRGSAQARNPSHHLPGHSCYSLQQQKASCCMKLFNRHIATQTASQAALDGTGVRMTAPCSLHADSHSSTTRLFQTPLWTL